MNYYFNITIKNINKVININFDNEAKATVIRKDDNYIDLSKDSLVNKGISRLTDEQLLELFKTLRLRFDLTPKCNIWCFFCSNEGSNYTSKCQKEMDIDLVIKLSDILIKNTPLKSIDFSGGEPTTHSDFLTKKFKLIEWTKKHPNIRFSLHSNGILLTPLVIDKIKDNFSRIGISLHSVNFDTWNKITNLNNHYSIEAQKKKFDSIMKNIEYLSKQGISDKVFIKSVVVKGVNDSKKELKDLMDFCDNYKFHPKLLEFEPQFPDHEKFIIGRKELFDRLEEIGCEFSDDTPRHNNPNTYIPGVNFEYKGGNCTSKSGLHSIFGCGDKAACESCYRFLCMFVKASEDGKNIYLKPCSTQDTKIDLTHALKRNDVNQILNLFRLSREYLMTSPGIGINHWNKEVNFKSKI